MKAASTLSRRQGSTALIEREDVSNVNTRQRIVFITTDAWLSEDRRVWTVPIHAWVHEVEKATVRRKALATALRVRYGLSATPATSVNFERRSRLILADNESGKRIHVRLAGANFVLPETAANGHAVGEFQIDAETVKRHAREGRLTYSAVLPGDDTRQFWGAVNLVPPVGISIISDFDDTIKVTGTQDRKRMFDQTFLKDFEAVQGMADVYASWAVQGAVFHFASSSPWHLYEPFNEYMDESGIPPRSMCLKHFRFRDKSLLNLFRKGTKTKPAQILPILRAYPQRRFILVGDSAQHDPEVYAEFARQFPGQIQRVYIRNVTQASPGDERFRAVFHGIERAKWLLFTDPAELALPE